ncbi:MAG TPA: phosphate acyltransferase PlsX [bacterium]|nr:phosphate acyltransferase PlsX [bacterium]
MRVAVDAMGGDHAPEAVISGAVAAIRELDAEIVLVGPETRLRQDLGRYRTEASSIEIVDAPEVIAMEEPPAMALRRKRRASIVVAFDQLHRGHVQAVVSAGHTGAALGAALLGLGRIPGVDRPAIATVIPTLGPTPAILVDAGATVDCKPQHLQQFALMGTVYANRVLGIANPRVGILSNGAEDGKGNDLTHRAAALLRESGLNFIGNLESRDFFVGQADVVVCDGFVGNVTLKFGEGLALAIRDIVKAELRGVRGVLLRLYLAPLAGRVRKMFRRIDYREVGGAPLLGINGVCIVAHGSSNGRAIRNAIRVAMEGASQGFVQEILTRMSGLPALESPDIVAGPSPREEATSRIEEPTR